MKKGIVIHYDSLTDSGLLRDEQSNLLYFRRAEVLLGKTVSANQLVLLQPESGPDAIIPIAEAAAIPQPPPLNPIRQFLHFLRRPDVVRWGGVGLSILPILIGLSHIVPRNPLLGFILCGLLLIEALFFLIGSTLRQLTLHFWRIALFTVFVYLVDSFWSSYLGRLGSSFLVFLGLLGLFIYLIRRAADSYTTN